MMQWNEDYSMVSNKIAHHTSGRIYARRLFSTYGTGRGLRDVSIHLGRGVGRGIIWIWIIQIEGCEELLADSGINPNSIRVDGSANGSCKSSHPAARLVLVPLSGKLGESECSKEDVGEPHAIMIGI